MKEPIVSITGKARADLIAFCRVCNAVYSPLPSDPEDFEECWSILRNRILYVHFFPIHRRN